MKTLGGRTVVITGGGSGVGAAIGLALAAEGIHLCLVGRRLERLEAVAAAAQALGAQATCCPADLAADADVAALTRRLMADTGGVDILVHSAAVLGRAPIEQASLQDFDNHYRVNVRAPYALTQALLPTLRSRKGEIVFINSSSAITAKPLFAQYDSTKHALKALADSLRAEVNAHGVRVLSVYLGRTATEMQAKLYEGDGRAYRPQDLLQPEDIASVVVRALTLPRTAEVTDIHLRPMIKS
jgi:NADP-dependent 3-hydroxy acid dehydrogenase YdfG